MGPANKSKKIKTIGICFLILLFIMWGLYYSLICKESIVFQGPDFEVGYYPDPESENLELIQSDVPVDIKQISRNRIYGYADWKCIFKYYTDESDIPVMKYIDQQAIIYRLYWSDELISTNFDPEFTEYKVATMKNNNGFFRWESNTYYGTTFSFDISKTGNYRIIFETKVLMNNEEKIYSNELTFTVIDNI